MKSLECIFAGEIFCSAPKTLSKYLFKYLYLIKNDLILINKYRDEEFEFKANAGGKLNDITMKKSITINLNDLTADAKNYMNSILQYLNIVIK